MLLRLLSLILCATETAFDKGNNERMVIDVTRADSQIMFKSIDAITAAASAEASIGRISDTFQIGIARGESVSRAAYFDMIEGDGARNEMK